METVQAFKASDGKLYETLLYCQEHEISLRWRKKIDEYIASPYCQYQKSVHKNMCSNMIIGWEQFKTKTQLED